MKSQDKKFNAEVESMVDEFRRSIPSSLHQQEVDRKKIMIKSGRKPSLDDYDKGLQGHTEYER